MHRNLITATVAIITSAAAAQDVPPPATGDRQYSPYPSQDFPNQVFFGDTHLHTSYSTDAGMVGNTLGPDEAYRFAKGETVTSSMGVEARLQRPLDFLVVADHGEGLGAAPLLVRSDPAVLQYELGRKLNSLMKEGTTEALSAAYTLWISEKVAGTNELATNQEFPIIAWEEIIDAAEAANDPGQFTAFIGYEWSSTPNGNNLHRVVVYRDGKDKANTRIPLSSDLNPDPEALWDWMEAYESETGGGILAIPHNGNLSNGLMFDDVTYSGDALSAAYAERRQKLEPLYEVTQMKGDGEAHPALSPDDAFADFETWDRGTFGTEPKLPDMLPREYAREALKRGLGYEDSLGQNPFKFGMIGSTDSHTSLSTSQENNFFGKVAQLEPTADPIRFEEVIVGRLLEDQSKALRAWNTSASGLAAVWARDNTREAIFDAMQRREVYATTGTRIRVRVFAGYDFEAADLPRSDFDAHGYANGVPMGADLPAGDGRPPRFLVRALRDPDGANLDRVQIVKGWLEADGTISERIYDIACGGREVADGSCNGEVGDTVDADAATYTNNIGQAILAGFWEDPEFDPTQRAFYYVRVLEIPTPRWTTYDRKFFGVELPEGAPVSIQDRAYTSPIWYAP